MANFSAVGLGDGERLPADMVIDCGGRRSRDPDWLKRIGSGLAVDEYMPFDLHYFARHYRLRPGAVFPSTCRPPDDSQIIPYGLFLVMAQDNGTFCLAGALSKSDPCRDRFREGSRFDAVMAALRGLQPWLEAGTPFAQWKAEKRPTGSLYLFSAFVATVRFAARRTLWVPSYVPDGGVARLA